MSDTKTEKKATSKPSYIAYQVRDGREGQNGFWTRIGAAFSHNDGKGFTIQVDAVPLDGRITLRVPSEKKE